MAINVLKATISTDFIDITIFFFIYLCFEGAMIVKKKDREFGMWDVGCGIADVGFRISDFWFLISGSWFHFPGSGYPALSTQH
jgi:hypothetical protein